MRIHREGVPGFDEVWRLEVEGGVAFVALHAILRGRAFGGFRIAPYRAEADARADALALARAMSRKVVMAGIAGGGGKIVLMEPAGGERASVVRRVGEFIESLGGKYCTGPDLGFTDRDGEALRAVTRYVASGTLGASTARSVLAAIDVACEPVTVAVQGLGATGRPLAEALRARGVRVVASDLRPFDDFERVDPEAIYGVPCDVFTPCAQGGVLDARTVALLRCRVVCGSANNPLASDSVADQLVARGIVYVPDFLANAGATIQGASVQVGEEHLIESRFRTLAESTRAVLEQARREGRSPQRVAVAIADERIAALRVTP